MKQEKTYNYEIYNQIWRVGDVQNPKSWSFWEITKHFKGKKNLEIGAGNYPKIPIKDSYFLDISESAVKKMEKLGGKAVVGDGVTLPFKDNFFDLIVATHVLEHIEDDKKAFSEIARVLNPSGIFLFSVPLRMELFSKADIAVGHKRRYEIKELGDLLFKNNLKILKYRPPSFYLELINSLGGFFGFKNAFIDKKNILPAVKRLPTTIFNFFSKIMAFLERKGAPPWKTDIEDLFNYKGKKITLFCQKKAT